MAESADANGEGWSSFLVAATLRGGWPPPRHRVCPGANKPAISWAPNGYVCAATPESLPLSISPAIFARDDTNQLFRFFPSPNAEDVQHIVVNCFTLDAAHASARTSTVVERE